MYPLVWIRLPVAMDDDIENTSIKQAYLQLIVLVVGQSEFLSLVLNALQQLVEVTQQPKTRKVNFKDVFKPHRSKA